MAGKIDITASVLIALASFTAGHALAATNTLDAARSADSFSENTRSMASGTMLDGRAAVRPVGQPALLLAQAQEPPAGGQENPELLLKKQHEGEAHKPEHAQPHEAPAAPKPAHEAPPPHEAKEPPPPRAPEPPKVEPPKVEQPRVEPPKPEQQNAAPKHIEPPPPPRAEPAPEQPKPKAREAAPAEMAPAEPPEVKHRAPDAEKPPVAPKPKHEKPAEPAAPMPPVEGKEPVAPKAAPEQAPEGAAPARKHKDAEPPKAEKAPAPAELAPPVETPAEKPVPKPKPPAASQQEAPPAKAEEKPGEKPGEKPPVVTAPAAPTKTQPAPAEQPAEPNKVAPPPVAAPAGEAPVKQRPAKPGQPEPDAHTPAPAGQAAPPPVPPAPNAASGSAPPVPPAPAPGDAAKGGAAPAAILPPLNTVQSREQNQPPQGEQAGQGGKGGVGGKPGRPGQPGQPPQVPEAARPQFSQEQQPFTPKELQRLKALAARPDQSNDTIVLPVDNGAPVLDSDKDANWRRGMTNDQLRQLRQRSAQQWNYAVPTSDEQAQQEYYGNRKRPPIEIESIDQYQGRRLQRPPQFLYPEDVRVGQEFDDDRRVMDYDGQIVVRGDDNRRFEQYGRPVIYEQVDHQRIRETVFKKNGDRIVTLRNRYGQLIQRSRIDADGREIVLFYSPALYEADDSREVVYRDPGASLPPMRLRVPLNDYIVDVGSQPNRDYYDFIEQPPVEPVERVYTIDEVRNSARIRDKMRRIDLDTITFATGSWDISMNQAGTLKKVADAMAKVLRNNPAETFLIEGHTDAVGSAESNLVLSDRRAQAVADVLTQVYGIPPENMVTQGYGEQFLKVMTYGPEQQNRRVTIRRVTPLVRPVQ